jgi:hypothetical protein
VSDALDDLWDAARLAAYLHLSVLTVQAKVSRAPDTLPPRVPGLHKQLWHPRVVEAWVTQERPAKRKGGRPRMAT